MDETTFAQAAGISEPSADFTRQSGTHTSANAFAQAAGLVAKPTLTPSPTTSSDSADPWSNFKSTAARILLQRKLPTAVLPVLLSQAALESARGTAAPGNNYFGIKGGGSAGSNNLSTQEYGNGGYYGENSDFAAYNSPDDSINAYLDLIQGYQGVPEAIQSNNPDAIIKAIEANGYATSPTYVQDIENTPEFGGKY